VDDELIAAVEDEHDCLEQPPLGVKAEPQLTGGRIVVEVLDP
jgi:hypothetical protein